MFSSRLIDRRLYSEAYPATALVLVAATLLVAPLRSFLDLSNVALLYVLAVVLAGARYGRSAAIFAALLGSLLFAYVFVPPHFSLAITDVQYLLSAVIMLVVALLVGHLTANLRTHAEIVEAQAAQTKSLYEFARQLTATRSSDAVIDASLHFLAHSLGASQASFVATDQIESFHESLESFDKSLETPDGKAASMVSLPLRALEAEQGSIRFQIDRSQIESTQQKEFLETIGSLIAVALERTHYLEMARDIEVRHAAESLRNTILSSLSHDIRTPLTSLVGTADTLLLAHALPREKQHSLLQGLREQALSIHQFVNNLLDMARLQSGNVELNLAWQPIEEAVGAALQQIRSVAESRVIAVNIDKDLPPLKIDATLMERALWNLLENAVKYSPDDTPIELNIRRIKDGGGDNIDIEVCDRGPGLPSDDGESLFGLFQRGQTESSVPGVGIGLAIVKSIADVHQGKLWARQRNGGGSCFHLSLPVGQPPEINFGEET